MELWNETIDERKAAACVADKDSQCPSCPLRCMRESVGSIANDTYLGTQRDIVRMTADGTPRHSGSSVLKLRDLRHGHVLAEIEFYVRRMTVVVALADALVLAETHII